MDHVTIEEQNVAERYLMGKLSAADEARFVEHYLDCPECLEKLELSKRLHQGLREIAAEEGQRTAVRSALLAWILQRGRRVESVLVLGLLAALVLSWAWLGPRVAQLSSEQARLARDLTEALAPQAAVLAVSLSPERSGPDAEPSTRLTLGPTPEWVVLALELPPSQTAASYRVRLREAAGESLWESGRLEPDAAGRVTLSVHSSWLEASRYVVELTPHGEAEPVARFAFGVRRDE